MKEKCGRNLSRAAEDEFKDANFYTMDQAADNFLSYFRSNEATLIQHSRKLAPLGMRSISSYFAQNVRVDALQVISLV